jgi:hypothetical protein
MIFTFAFENRPTHGTKDLGQEFLPSLCWSEILNTWRRNNTVKCHFSSKQHNFINSIFLNRENSFQNFMQGYQINFDYSHLDIMSDNSTLPHIKIFNAWIKIKKLEKILAGRFNN